MNSFGARSTLSVDGRDFPAGEDPDADKSSLEASYCDPRVRERFIAALTLASAQADRR